MRVDCSQAWHLAYQSQHVQLVLSLPLSQPYCEGVVLPAQAVSSTYSLAPFISPCYLKSHLALSPVAVHIWPWSSERRLDNGWPWPYRTEGAMSWQDFVKHVVQGFKIY